MRTTHSSPATEEGLSAGEIRAELDRVLTFPDFAASRHLINFLRFVVEESLAGRAEFLKERTVALGALGREADFDPRVDCIVRVMAGKLRRALERYYATLGASNPLSIVIRAGSYAPEFQQTARLAAVERSNSSATEDRPPRLMRDTTGRPLLVVIPFSLLTPGAEERILAELVADEVVVRLSRISWLEVAECALLRSPAAHLQQSATAWARDHADFALAGTVSRTGNSFRLSTRLIDARSGVLAWAEQRDVPTGAEPLGSHESVAHQIVTTVGDVFGVLTTAAALCLKNKRFCKFTAFESILSALQYQCRLDHASFPCVLRTVQRGVMENPDFGWGWAALAALHLDLLCGIAKGASSDESEQALAYIKRALKTDPNCSFSHFLRGMHHLFHGRVEEAIRCADLTHAFAQGMPFEVGAAGLLMSLCGDEGRGQPLVDGALRICPRLPGWMHWGSAICSLGKGDVKTTMVAIEKFTLPDCFWDPFLCAAAYTQAGNRRAARIFFDQACSLQPELIRRPNELIGMVVAEPKTRELLFDVVREWGLRIRRPRGFAKPSRWHSACP